MFAACFLVLKTLCPESLKIKRKEAKIGYVFFHFLDAMFFCKKRFGNHAADNFNKIYFCVLCYCKFMFVPFLWDSLSWLTTLIVSFRYEWNSPHPDLYVFVLLVEAPVICVT